MIRQDLCYSEKYMNPFSNGVLEQQCIELKLENNNSLRILNVYNPNGNLTIEELHQYIDQLADTYMLVEDFNGHSPVLSTRVVRSNATGKCIGEALLNYDICLANEVDFYTYIDRNTGRSSCLDLIFSSSDIISGVSLERAKDVGSDHFPILAKTNVHTTRVIRRSCKRWIIEKDDISKFRFSVSVVSAMQLILKKHAKI